MKIIYTENLLKHFLAQQTRTKILHHICLQETFPLNQVL